jgi:hypothetical protein
MNSTPVIDMFSGTGQLAVAVTRAIHEPTSLVSFSDNYGPARKYLHHRFPEMLQRGLTAVNDTGGTL